MQCAAEILHSAKALSEARARDHERGRRIPQNTVASEVEKPGAKVLKLYGRSLDDQRRRENVYANFRAARTPGGVVSPGRGMAAYRVILGVGPRVARHGLRPGGGSGQVYCPWSMRGLSWPAVEAMERPAGAHVLAHRGLTAAFISPSRGRGEVFFRPHSALGPETRPGARGVLAACGGARDRSSATSEPGQNSMWARAGRKARCPYGRPVLGVRPDWAEDAATPLALAICHLSHSVLARCGGQMGQLVYCLCP